MEKSAGNDSQDELNIEVTLEMALLILLRAQRDGVTPGEAAARILDEAAEAVLAKLNQD